MAGLIFFSVEHRVGRITGRLPQELADQIVENVLELFRLFRPYYIVIYIAQNECQNVYSTFLSILFPFDETILYSTNRNQR